MGAGDSVAEFSARPGARWYLDAVAARQPVTTSEVGANCAKGFLDAVGIDTVTGWISRMAAQLEIAHPVTVDGDRLRVPLRPVGSIPRWRVLLTLDTDDRISMFEFGELEVEGVELEMVPTGSLDREVRPGIHRLFDLTYDNADHDYLDESLTHLEQLALGRAEGEVVGFALGGCRTLDIPRRPGQVVKLAGLVCIDPGFRRRGLASRLGERSIAGGNMAAEECLFGGRMAHPASFRQASARRGVVPRPDRRPNAWQRECGAIIAGLLGVTDFDPETFVCGGRSRPIGDPKLEVDVAAEEWRVFEPVDRSKGQTLLGMWWGGDPGPDGWIDDDPV